jgi:hypothetical protein
MSQVYGRGKDFDLDAAMKDLHKRVKKCSVCGAIKPLEEFHKKASSPTGYKAECAQCARFRWQAFAKENREKLQISDRTRHYTRKYGIDRDIAEMLVRNREGVCDIVIDHNHSTGKIRGGLCNNCNGLLGLAKDSVETLISAIKYLQGGTSVES